MLTRRRFLLGTTGGVLSMGFDSAQGSTGHVVRSSAFADPTIRAIQQAGAGFENVRDHGAVGDGITNDTAAFQSAMDAAASSGDGGGVLVPPGRYLVDQINAASNVTVLAHGAVLLHTGGATPLLNIHAGDTAATNINRFVWHGGTLVAAKALDATTALIYLRNAWNGEFVDIELEGGDETATETSRYATYGILIEGRQNAGTYWHNWYGISVRGCATAAARVDGFDAGTGLNHTGPNWWHGIRFVYNEAGYEIHSSNYEIFLGGQIEQNAGYGLYLDYFSKDTDAFGLHLEHNNGGAANPQFYVETRAPSGFTQSQNARRNRIRGAISGDPTNNAGDAIAAVRHLAIYENVGNMRFGVVPRALQGIVLQRETETRIAFQTRVDGETFERFRLPARGELQFRDPTADVGDFFIALQPTALNEVATGNGVRFWSIGGLRVGANGTTITKSSKTSVLVEPPSVPANSTVEFDVAFAGAAANDAVTIMPRATLEDGLAIAGAYVNAADTITIRLANVTGSPIDPAQQQLDIELREYS